ncbi:transposase [Streptomyces mirabilis]|uniref:transposase n=1 Tax=Streptomyces mirabilis TaxID=68239 RepID=UPI0036DA8A22
MTDAEWAEVRSAMPVPAWLLKLGGRPEAFYHREMLDAVRYLVDNGVKWTALPVDFPYWRAVYDFFRRWRSYDYVRELYERLRRSARECAGRNAEPSAGIIDSQSVDASETVGEDSRGYDGGKSRDGRKRHILTDTEGLLLDVTVTTADVQRPLAIHRAGAARSPSGSRLTTRWHGNRRIHRALLGQHRHELLTPHPGSLDSLSRGIHLRLSLLQDLRPGLQLLPCPRLTPFHQPQHRRHRTLLGQQQAVRCLPPTLRDHALHTKKPLLIEQGLPLAQRTESPRR